MEPQLILPLCLNHAETPGEVREVHPCECCRNFEARQAERADLPPVPPGPEVKYIPLGRNQFAIVDAADFEWLKRVHMALPRWGWPRGLRLPCANTARGSSCTARSCRPRRAWWPTTRTTIRSITAACNLRNCTRQQNSCNRRPGRNQSGFVGVHPYGKKWLAKIHSGGKIVYREVFDDKVEAAKARDRKAYELFGPFAYLNFPEEIPAAEAAPPAPPGPRYVDLSGSARARSCAHATLTVIHVGRVP